MRRLVVVPAGWPCTYAECRPGLFVIDGHLNLKTEYGSDGYCDSGEAFWGGVSGEEARNKLTIQPVDAIWEEFEE